MEIIKETESPLLSRKEVEIEIKSEPKTPSKDDLKKKISDLLKSSPELIVIKKVITSFGSRDIKVIAYQYMSKEKMDEIEPRSKKKEEKKEEKK